MQFNYIVNLVSSLVGVLFMGLTYTYLDKLEKIGCVCAEHPYRKFVKNFVVFAIFYLLVTMLIPPEQLVSTFGSVGGIFVIIHYLFALACLVFFVLAIIYVRYLMTEKCKCSDDFRREVLYYVSILQVLFLFFGVILGIILSVVSSSIVLAMNTVKSGTRSANTIVDAVRNPVGAVKKIPGSIKSVPKSFKKSFASIRKGSK
jgi:hypothetical protein